MATCQTHLFGGDAAVAERGVNAQPVNYADQGEGGQMGIYRAEGTLGDTVLDDALQQV